VEVVIWVAGKVVLEWFDEVNTKLQRSNNKNKKKREKE
jgi:hypothetical protein